MRTVLGIMASVFVVMAGCDGNLTYDTPNGTSSSGGTHPICTDGIGCCTQAEIVCTGNPDKDPECSCYKAWECNTLPRPDKCVQPKADTPDGQGSWTCSVSGAKEVCTRPGNNSPEGQNGWSCKSANGQTSCERSTNTPDGSGNWICTYDEFEKTCVSNGQTNGSGNGTGDDSDDSGKDNKNVIPSGGGGWNCTQNEFGEDVCTKPGTGTPGGGNWQCQWDSSKITCEGNPTNGQNPNGSGGFSCTHNSEGEFWRCEKPKTNNDVPSSNGNWKCVSGSEWNGTTCIHTPNNGKNSGGGKCIPGQKRWCDGQAYCSWGIQTCKADGTWEKSCQEASDGSRPNTICGCYFFYFNPDCCETPDCVLPNNKAGQICSSSKGQYCDYCNPQKSECTNGATCIVSNRNESYCGKKCASNNDCPANSMCMVVEVKGGGAPQCVPNDGSCYY